jgi:hypothetical protein
LKSASALLSEPVPWSIKRPPGASSRAIHRASSNEKQATRRNVKFLFISRRVFIVKAMIVPFVDLQAQYQFIKQEVNTAIARVLDNSAFILGREVEAFETALPNTSARNSASVFQTARRRFSLRRWPAVSKRATK